MRDFQRVAINDLDSLIQACGIPRETLGRQQGDCGDVIIAFLIESEGTMSEDGQKGWKYWAFISYSSKDRGWGEWLIKELEGYQIPRSLVGLKTRQGAIPQRLYPVFRDRDELRVGSDVGSELRNALLESRFLIVICSPNSADPRSWVGKEITAFKECGRGDDVLALIVDGEPNVSTQPGGESRECFPSSLRHRFDEMGRETTQPADPLAADVRREDSRPRVARRKALLKLIACMIDVDFDTLEQRDRRRRRQRMMIWSAASIMVLSIVAGLAGLWLSNSRIALSQKLAKQAKAESGVQHDRALLLSVLSYRVSKTPAAFDSILTTISANQNLIAYLQHPTKVSAVAFTPDEKYLAVAACVSPSCELSTITCYDLDTLGVLGQPLEIAGEVREMLFQSPTTNLIVLHGSGKEQEVARLDLRSPSTPPSLIYRSSDPVTSIQVSEDGRFYAVGMKGGEYKVFPDGAGRRCGGILDGLPPVITMAFSADSAKFAALNEADMHVINLKDDTCPVIRQRPGRQIAAAAFDVTGSDFYVVLLEGTVYRWEIAEKDFGSYPFSFEPTKDVRSYPFSFEPTNGYMHSLDRQARFMASLHTQPTKHLRIYDLKRDREIEKSIKQNPDSLQLREIAERGVEVSRFDGVDARHIVFSSSAELVATIDTEGDVIVWSTAKRPLVEISDSEQEATSISKEAVSPDGRLRVEVEAKSEGCGPDFSLGYSSCQTWVELRLTDVETNLEISRLSGPRERMPVSEPISVAFKPDGSVAVQRGGWDEVWRISPETLIARACKTANRNLDESEVDQYLSWGERLLWMVQPCEGIIRSDP